MREKNPVGFFSFALIFSLSIAAIGVWIDRSQSGLLLVSFSSSFICYLLILQTKDSYWHLLTIGLFTRLILFMALPTLSDDVYRFIWDGNLLKSGIHPFAELPSHYVDHPVVGANKELFNRLNSPDYFTIYPPLNQALFWLSVQFGDSWLLSTNIIRAFLLLADIGSFFLLKSLLKLYTKDQHLAFWYFLNPLVILELTGNLHFEGLVVFFLLLGLYGYKKGQKWKAISGFGLAVGTKLLPIIYLPALFFLGLRNKKWWIPVASGLLGVLTISPMLDQTFIQGMTSSLDLYFRKFEFNASIYFIAREIGYWIYGYNNIAKIGPLLSVLSFVSILLLSGVAAYKRWESPKAFLFILCIYIVFGTIIHPWYIIPLIVFGLLSGYRFPILWSFLIFLTYLGYSKTGFELPMWIVVLEYITVTIFAVSELKSKKLT